MKVLSIDTSSNICGVAILKDNKLIKEISLDNGLTHSESLMPTIDQIFKETKLSLKDIDLLVCDKGPGSFTGIRIGVSTVMAFSDSLGIPSVGITSLETLAHNVETDGIICSLIDAKNSNCYFGLYELIDEKYTILHPLVAHHIDDIINILKEYSKSITFVGSGSIVNETLIKEQLTNCIISDNNNLSAYKLGLAGLKSYKSGNYENVMPLYLRKSQAERNFEESLGT
ncbi:MAG: tRNA (adenosine(37)-N6)-threonylcarbamoyltransferase complex dimerization subunit type 1 TsaB [Clostridia bacterium]|nr:tRNA (adenosine(37)-N6)-threonylcarbamoyltransferase complex dimerization subunit type 1 TsaB [Clostridia bacterium]